MGRRHEHEIGFEAEPSFSDQPVCAHVAVHDSIWFDMRDHGIAGNKATPDVFTD
jgi:hypothetical protein